MNDNNAKANDFLDAIIGHAPFGIITINRDGEVTMCNKLALHQLGFGLKPKSIIKKQLVNYTKPIRRLHKKMLQCFEKGLRDFNLNNVKSADRVLTIKGRRISNGMIITTADITESKETARKIMNAMLEGQENERRRLAKEIHDGIGPLMSTIRLNIESVKNDMEHASEKTLQKIDNMESLIQSVSTDIRSISHALMPSSIKDFGLVSALENLCLKANMAEIVQVQFIHQDMEERLNVNIELGLYRIVQELINNALKYAQANVITIQALRDKKNITLTVEDDGIGFDKDKIKGRIHAGIGLQNIKTRTEIMKGTFTIEASPAHGVVATVEVPL